MSDVVLVALIAAVPSTLAALAAFRTTAKLKAVDAVVNHKLDAVHEAVNGSLSAVTVALSDTQMALATALARIRVLEVGRGREGIDAEP